jgi:hypothetical protein
MTKDQVLKDISTEEWQVNYHKHQVEIHQITLAGLNTKLDKILVQEVIEAKKRGFGKHTRNPKQGNR